MTAWRPYSNHMGSVTLTAVLIATQSQTAKKKYEIMSSCL